MRIKNIILTLSGCLIFSASVYSNGKIVSDTIDNKSSEENNRAMEDKILQKAREIEARRSKTKSHNFISNIMKNMYFGVGFEYGHSTASDKISTNERQYTWNEQKVDYLAGVQSSLQIPETDENGEIMYNKTGAIKFKTIPDPKDDERIRELYFDQNGNSLPAGTINNNKEAIKKRLGVLFRDTFINSKFIRGFALEGINEDNNPNYITKSFKGTNVRLQVDNDNIPSYADNINNDQNRFYFGETDEQGTVYYQNDGLNNIKNLQWRNLILTSYQGADNNGPQLTFPQLLGDILEYAFNAEVKIQKNNDFKGMFTYLLSERYLDGDSDKFSKSNTLSNLNTNIRSSKPSSGLKISLGYELPTNIYSSIEFAFCLDNSKVRPVQFGNEKQPKTNFAAGTINYVDKNEHLYNPRNKNDLGPVYDKESGKICPVKNSGLGRMTGATPKTLKTMQSPYSLTLKKKFSFSITPVLGLLQNDNILLYVSCGITMNNYKATFIPNTSILSQYNNLVPVGIVHGYMEGLDGKTYVHKYSKQLRDGSSTEFKNERELPRISPNAIIEENSAGEKNVFSGIRINYPHHEDGGMNLVGESVGERPWLNDGNNEKALSRKNKNKFLLNFEPGFGMRVLFDKNIFVDIRYSLQLGFRMSLKYPEFAYYPMHMGRENMKHKLKISSHKFSLVFGKHL